MSTDLKSRWVRVLLSMLMALATAVTLFTLLSFVCVHAPDVVVAQVLPHVTEEPPPQASADLPLYPPASLRLTADPAQGQSGTVVTVVATIYLDTDLGGAMMRAFLPAGFVFQAVQDEDAYYVAEEHTLYWPLAGDQGTDELQFQILIGADAPDLSVLKAELRVAGFRAAVVASVEIRRLFPAAEVVISAEAGGELHSADGRVRVIIPPGAVSEAVRVEHVPGEVKILGPTLAGMALEFELNAFTADGLAEPVHDFAQPLELWVDLDGLVDWGSMPYWQHTRLAYRDEPEGTWVDLPCRRKGSVLISSLDHLSYLGGGTDYEMESGWVLAFNDAHVSAFNGGLNYEYPIQVPEGRGGLAPDLDLNYNSRRVDGILTWVQSDWVGLGWTLGTMEIVRKVKPDWDGDEGEWDWMWEYFYYENEFTLLYKGTGITLASGSDTNPYGRYYTDDEQFLYIERCNAEAGNESEVNATGEYWIVRLRDGTEYRLGYERDSEQIVKTYYYGSDQGNECHWTDGNPPTSTKCYAGDEKDHVAFRWRVDMITDTRGNEVEFSYSETPTDTNPCGGYRDRSNYLSEVRYNRLEGGGWGTRISFITATRSSDGIGDTFCLTPTCPGSTCRPFYQDDFLSSIKIEQYVDGSYQTIRGYNLTYDARYIVPGQEHDNDTRRLASIREYGYGGISGAYALPTTTFGYEVFSNTDICQIPWGGDCTDGEHDEWDQECFRYERLVTITNGYGGQIVIDYDHPSDEDTEDVWWKAWNYRVREKRVSDGQGGGYKSVFDYTSVVTGGRCYDHNSVFGCDPGITKPGGSLVGYKWVTETLKTLSDETVAVISHTFELNSESESPPNHRLGREKETIWRDPSGTDLKKVVIQSAQDVITHAGGDSYFVYTQYVTEYLRAGGSLQKQKSTYYAYETSPQGGTQYGNLTKIVERDGSGTARRRTMLWYFPNASDTWIVDKPAQRWVVNPEGGLTESIYRYVYDSITNTYSAPPTRGDLAWISQTTKVGAPGDWITLQMITYHSASDYHLPIETADGNHNVTAVQYDPVWKMYPVTITSRHSVTPSLSLTTTNEYTYTWGKVITATGPNGADTATGYEYDYWGRLNKIIRPGDSSIYPTLVYSYCDTCLPLRIVTQQRITSGQAATIPAIRFYNGMGQLIEENLRSSDDSTMVVQHVTYNAQGLQEYAYAPYVTTTVSWDYVDVLTSTPKTSYLYDALGRPVIVTDTAGYTVCMRYDGLRKAVIDENAHQKIYGHDSLGRVITVTEHTATCPSPPCWGDPPYATTWYTYTTLDQLSQVVDELGNTTVITYDAAGRKTAMHDPDMSDWSYGYDNASNLISQTNAKGQTITMTYDGLNRLAGKSYPAGSEMTDVAYSYDSTVDGNLGKGLRTGMTDGSGSTAWIYDERGRVLTETKVITCRGGGTFTTGWAYDAADRVKSMTYPNGEVVTTTYNAMGQPYSLKGTLSGQFTDYPYVADTFYNALGQMTHITMSDSLITRWGYWGLDGQWDTHPDLGLQNFGRLWHVRTAITGGEPLLDLRYNYDAGGNITETANFRYEASNWPTSGFIVQDTFEVSNTMTFTYGSNITVPFDDGENDVARSTGTGSDYSAAFTRTGSLANGQGLQLRFKVDADDTQAHFLIQSGAGQNYRHFGVYAKNSKLYVQYASSDKTVWYPVELLTTLPTNTWYVVRIVVDDSSGFYVEAYKQSDPAVRGSYHMWMPTGRDWTFRHCIKKGHAYIDDYREFSTADLEWSPAESMEFVYDGLDRITSTGAVSGWGGYTNTYTYNQIGNITETTQNTTTWTYTYPSSGPSSVRPHAVSSVNSWSYQYDANGNMVTRTLGSDTYVLKYDVEGRVVEVKKNDNEVAMFMYDGDGNQVKVTRGSGVTSTTVYVGNDGGEVEVPLGDGVTTVYIGNYYQKEGNTTRTYYYHNGQRVAVRENGTLYWLLKDHLGSTAVVVDASGTVAGERRYLAYGDTRAISGTLPTRYGFTGQREESLVGLYFYKARWYDPVLRRFVQADTVVPEAGNPQALNRYSYVYNNPLRYTDPSGLFSEQEIMEYLGAASWEDVLAFFNAGGQLEGRWGWLAVLREAYLGDEVQFLENYAGFWPAPGPGASIVSRGTFVECNGSLYLQGDAGGLMAANEAAQIGNAYLLARPSGEPRLPTVFGPYYAERTYYYHLGFDPHRVDWVGVGVAGGGMVADIFTYGAAGRAANAAEIARTAGQVGKASGVIGLARSGPPLVGGVLRGDLSLAEMTDFGLDVVGLWIPVVPDFLSLVLDLAQGFYRTP